MEAVLGLLVMLLGVCHGVGTYCDGRQDGAQCYGALGGIVILQLMDNSSEISGFYWRKESQIILKVINNRILSYGMENRYLFIPSNGKFRINNLNMSDGGEYTLDMFNSDRQLVGTRTLQLTIKAPVSSVQLVSECLSQREMKVSCYSKGGESPQYSWILDGHFLTDTELLAGNPETDVITLKQHVSGRLVCSVLNLVSSASQEMDMCPCGFIFTDCISNGTRITMCVHKENATICREPTTVPTTDPSPLLVCGLRAILVILLLTGIYVYFIWNKKRHEKVEGSAGNPENSVMMVEMRSSAP